MARSAFAPGFRLSIVDVVILVVGVVAAVGVGMIDRWAGLAVAWVVGHFFMFCNVLRMARALELAWAGVCAGLMVLAIGLGVVGWPAVFLGSGATTLVLSVVATRMPSYHGVGWRRLNPGLPRWWERGQMTETRDGNAGGVG